MYRGRTCDGREVGGNVLRIVPEQLYYVGTLVVARNILTAVLKALEVLGVVRCSTGKVEIPIASMQRSVSPIHQHQGSCRLQHLSLLQFECL